MIILSVINPSTPVEAEAIKAWLQVALNIADLLVKGTGVKTEVCSRLPFIPFRLMWADEGVGNAKTPSYEEDC
jgi:hypothetical protein